MLEMGEPVKIVDLARQMIEFSREGRSAEIPMTYSGLRPGEKLHEKLLCTGERAAPTSHSMVRLAVLAETNAPGAAGGNGADGKGAAGGESADGSDHPNPSALPSDFATDLDHLIALAEAHAGAEEIIPALKAVVPTYEPFDLSLIHISEPTRPY